MNSPSRSFLSPPHASFIEPPLSTKRERLLHPARIASVPRAARTAPARSRYVHHRFELQRPHQVTFLPGNHDTVMKSASYNPEYDATYYDQMFQVVKILGEGSFGEVVCVKSREDQKLYAVKRVLDPYRSESDRKAKLREVQKHEMIPPHSNILEFIKAWEEKGRLYLQTELCEQSLAEYTQVVNPVPEDEVWDYFMDIAQAVDHLHNHNLIHMDIKPENILMTKDKICKLGDFGRVFDLKTDKKDVAEEGDSKYLAREVLNNPPTKAADIFSLGMTILEIATDMELPSQGERWHQIREGRIPDSFFSHISTELKEHIMHMIHANPKMRPTSKVILNFFSNRLRSRKKHIYVNEIKHRLLDALFTAYLFVLGIYAAVKEIFHSCGSAIFAKHDTVPRTPVTTRLTVPNIDAHEWNYSDDVTENPFDRHHGHSLQRHPSATIYPENPCPRYRLNFDGDDDTTSSTSNDSGKASSPPEILTGTPPSARKSVKGSNSNIARNLYYNEAGGDWKNANHGDSDSDEETFRRCAMTAPPRLPLRTAFRYRANRPPPRLNLDLLGSPERVDPLTKEKTPSPKETLINTPRQRRTRIQQRLISHDDSADDF